MDKNTLAKVFDWLGEVFERFNPAAFRFLAAFLPYLSPFPVAWLTQHSAGRYLGFTPSIGFIFVFTLEGIGLWFTSLLVDSVVDWIKSKNGKSGVITLILGFAVVAYIAILILLNVILESNTDGYTATYGLVVALLCLLPLITGIGNGYYKYQLKSGSNIELEREYQRGLEEKIRQEKREDRMKSKLIKAGINPLAFPSQNFQSTTEVVEMESASKGDWRLLTSTERNLVRTALSVSEIMTKHNVSRSTAFEWKKK